MIASDYPISFPYGSTAWPYAATHPHRGDDRGCPVGTPVTINGQQIGLTGATGFVIGAHLHIQEWRGNYANTRKPQNAFQPGVVVNVDRVGTYPNNKNDGTQGDGTFGKFITVRNADGWNDTYCHLSEINVKVGDIIGGTMGKWDNGKTYNLLFKACNAGIAERAKAANYVGYFGAEEGKDAAEAYDVIIGSPQFDYLVQEAHQEAQNPGSGYVKIGNVDGVGDVFKKG